MALNQTARVALVTGLVLVVVLAAVFFVYLPSRRTAKVSFVRWATPAELQTGTFEHVKLADQTKGVLALDAAVNSAQAAGPMPESVAASVFSGSYNYGTYTSPVQKTTPFNWAVASWDATTPPGTWIQIELRATIGGRQTSWYNMGIWASGTETINRQSVDGQGDQDGKVATDTLMFGASVKATGVQYRVSLFSTDPAVTPQVRSVQVVALDIMAKDQALPADKTVWGTDLPVPERSQMDYLPDGSGWCSPTSTSMAMEYWAGKLNRPELNQTVPDVAAACYDYVYRGTGNWPFNTAAAAANGLQAQVSRFESVAQIEQWIKIGVPVIIGISFSPGELDGAPISSTDGHLILVRGFDKDGNVICNDPAAKLAQGQKVYTVYKRQQLEHAWLGASGIVYLIYPEGQPIPANSHGAWQEPASK